MNRLEALLDSLAEVNGRSDPSSPCYKIKNLLLTKSFAREGNHEVDECGRRKYRSWGDAYKSGLFDLGRKITGESKATVVVSGVRRKLASDDDLEKLLNVYGIDHFSESAVVGFLRIALEDDSIDVKTPMKYFLEEN